jgi:mRNA interferase HigB
MRIIKESFLKAAANEHRRAAEGLATWIAMVRAAQWQNPVEMKQAAPEVDPVKVKSGRTVYIFNIRRNEFRLIAAVHFNRQIVFTLRFLNHAEYEINRWKTEL